MPCAGQSCTTAPDCAAFRCVTLGSNGCHNVSGPLPHDRSASLQHVVENLKIVERERVADGRADNVRVVCHQEVGQREVAWVATAARGCVRDSDRSNKPHPMENTSPRYSRNVRMSSAWPECIANPAAGAQCGECKQSPAADAVSQRHHHLHVLRAQLSMRVWSKFLRCAPQDAACGRWWLAAALRS